VLSEVNLASWVVEDEGLSDVALLADAQLLFCATMSRAHSSQFPHWVATPSSNWISSKLMPARAWQAISRSEIRWHTQTIMRVGRPWLAVGNVAQV